MGTLKVEEGALMGEEGKLKVEEDKHSETEEDMPIVDKPMAAVNSRPGAEGAHRQVVAELDAHKAEVVHIHIESFESGICVKLHMTSQMEHDELWEVSARRKWRKCIN